MNAALLRRYWPLLLALGLTQLAMQLDMLWLAHHHPDSVTAYLVMLRMAALDAIVQMASGTVMAVQLARTPVAERGQALCQIGLLLLGLGLLLTGLGHLVYPALARLLVDVSPVQQLLLPAIDSFVLATPLRLLANAGLFLLHGQGDGARVVRYKLLELLARAGLGAGLVLGLNAGLSGCFLAQWLSVGGLAWFSWRALQRRTPLQWPPHWQWARRSLAELGWEAQRLASAQGFALAGLGVFAARLGSSEAEQAQRLAAYCTGSALAGVCHVPLIALLRTLAVHLPSLPTHDAQAMLQRLRRHGLPWVMGLALLIGVGVHALGQAVYAQHGRWWDALAGALALSLPVRYLANLARAEQQSQAGFARLARWETGCSWLLGLPLMLAGVALSQPWLAAGYLLWPECVLLWRLQRMPAATLALSPPARHR